MDKPKMLYRGSRERIEVLIPQPILESERERFPSGVEEVVFASQYRQEALAYAIASRHGVGSFLIVPYWKDQEGGEIGWKLELTCQQSQLALEEKTYLYEIGAEGFSQNVEGEWYSTAEVCPLRTEEITVGEALREFDEVKFRPDPEVSLASEGNGTKL